MCEPTTIAVIGLALTAVSGYVAYDTSKKAQEYNEQVAEIGKKTAEAQALDAQQQGQIERQERRLKTRMQIATQQVGFAAQGMEQSGTALDILGDTAMFGEIDENRITANADRRAFGYKTDAFNIESGKRIGAFQGKNDRTGTILTTGASLLSGSQSLYSANKSSSFNSRTGGYGVSGVQRESIGMNTGLVY